MGNCLRKCFGGFDRRRKFLNTRYAVENESSVEFENLMDEDVTQTEMSKLVTERERQLLTSKQYNTLIHEQTQRDAEIDAKLRQQEEELRREEEAYQEARQEAGRIAQLQKAQQDRQSGPNHTHTWVPNDGDWDTAGGEDDFEVFLESVKARSLKATAHLRQQGPHDGQSSNSSSTPPPQGTRARSRTNSSAQSQTDGSMDLEWDHKEDVGTAPQRKPRSSTEEDLANIAKSGQRVSPQLSDDFEWDSEFTASEDRDTQSLLTAERRIKTALVS